MSLSRIFNLLFSAFTFFTSVHAETKANFIAQTKNDSVKMKVEIWSDVMCPFCYIGKRNFEKALSGFSNAKKIEIIWKSFQLDPSIRNGETPDYKLYLSKRKGMSLSHVTQMLENVTEMAANSGITFHLEKAIISNSFDAHRLSHLAAVHGKQNEAEELLFAAHFTEGKDISSAEVLVSIGEKLGIDKKSVTEMLHGKLYAKDVLADIEEASWLGVQGVPFFVFNRKYAVSGAQPAESFSQVLQKSFGEWEKENPASKFEITNGPSCTPDGECK